MPNNDWKKRAAKLSKKRQAVANALAGAIGLAEQNKGRRSPAEAELIGLLGWETGTPPEQGFSPDGDHYAALAALIGKENAATTRRLWERRALYPYDNPGNFGYRTADAALVPIRQHVDTVLAFATGAAAGFSVDAYLGERGKGDKAARFGYEPFYADQALALRLDEGPDADAVFGRVAAIATDVTGGTSLTPPIVGALLRSRRDDAHALAEKLLLEAGLLESQRMTVLLGAGGGSREGFSRIFEAVVDNNLVRFPAAVTAFNNWTGLNFQPARTDDAQKAAALAFRCLTDAAFRKKCQKGTDPLGQYLALWAEGREEIAAAAASAAALVDDGKRHNRAAAALFLSRTVATRVRLDTALAILGRPADRKDAQLTGLAFQLLGGLPMRLDEHPADPLMDRAYTGLVLTADEVRRAYGIFKNALDAMPDKKADIKAEINLADRVRLSYSAESFLSQMISLAGRAVVRPVRPTPGQPGMPAVIKGEDAYAGVREKWGLPAPSMLPLFSPYVADSLDDDPAGVNIRDDLCSYAGMMRKMTPYALVAGVVRDGSGSAVQRETLLRLLGQAGMPAPIWHYCAKLDLTEDECRRIEGYVQKGDGTLRQAVMVKLLTRAPDGLSRSIQRLLASKSAPMRKAGDELVDILSRHADDPEYRQVYADCLKAAGRKPVAATPPPRAEPAPAPAPVGFARGIPIMPVDAPEPAPVIPLTASEEGDGYGLYDPAIPPVRFTLRDVPDIARPDAGAKIFTVEPAELTAFADAVDALIAKHAGEEYDAVGNDGSKKTCVVGADRTLPLAWNDALDPGMVYRSDFTWRMEIGRYPFADEWRALLERTRPSAECLIFFNHIYGRFAGDFGIPLPTLPKGDGPCFPDKPWCERADELIHGLREHVKKSCKYPAIARAIAPALERALPPAERYPVLRRYFLAFRNDDLTRRKTESQDPMTIMQSQGGLDYTGLMRGCVGPDDDPLFADFFAVLYETRYAPGAISPYRNGLKSSELVRAHRQGLLPDNDVARLLLAMSRDSWQESYPDEYRVGNSFEILTHPRLANLLFRDDPAFVPLLDRFTGAAVDYELRRGEMSTPISKTVGSIGSFAGTRYFVELLEKLDGDPLVPVRYNPASGPNGTRAAMFSYLLRHCRPAPGEDGRTLTALLKGSSLTDQRLLDAAMFATQWIAPVAEHLGWKDLESMCWYFQAHINETFTVDRANAVARYSAVTPEEFNDGACDLDWYRSVRASLGDKRYKAVYKAAQNVTRGASYRRAQLFADAIDGKFAAADVARDIMEKRSQPKVLLYGLIPLDEKDPKADMSRRYSVLQEFLRQSRQFGVKRRASEARAVAMGLRNLALNAGYADVVRFTWDMEDALSAGVDPFAKRTLAGDAAVTVWLEPDDAGGVRLRVEKNGKAQKAVPAANKKDPVYQDLLEVRKDWRESQSRNRRAMEEAMIHGDVFDLADLRRLAKNPAFAPLIRSLVFKAGDRLDYIDNFPASATGDAVVAHPWHLREAGVWAKFQRDCFDRKIRQPFKQVFRELYLPTKEEADGFASRRYGGHEVRAGRAIGVMKSRGWLANFDGGMEKAYRREGLVAWMHSGIVWLDAGGGATGTADIETVTFARRGGGAVKLADVPPVIYSEVMRDLDLVVSVAFAGEKDPEASESTMEMRTALAAEMVRLFKLKNVEFKKAHAVIKGTRGDYTVHLGSGVVHKMASGALNVIAVPAQYRGGLFLPFLDDDPVTAEVMTKILLFARDGEIKDPAILQQINAG